MRTIIHLSDLHFGRVDRTLLEPLRRAIAALVPDVLVVSGDLTQRARPEEFRQARAFLDTLPQPRIVVPGNHDVPLYNLVQRFLRPLSNYRRYISENVEPSLLDQEIAVVGVNTARSLTFKGGRIGEDQVERVRAKLCSLPETIVKIVVTHHPFDVPPTSAGGHIVGRAPMAMEMLAGCGADILLAGHLHLSHTGDTTERYRIHGFAALIVQAGTATSTRSRGEVNAFNVLKIDGPTVSVERYEWTLQEARFERVNAEAFERSDRGWLKADSGANRA